MGGNTEGLIYFFFLIKKEIIVFINVHRSAAENAASNAYEPLIHVIVCVSLPWLASLKQFDLQVSVVGSTALFFLVSRNF